jgi:hypothetical protein
MRRSMLGALLIAGLVIAVATERTSSEPVAAATVDFPSTAPNPSAATNSAAANSELFTHVTPSGDGSQVVTVMDPRTRVMAVYHVERTSGKIVLKSVRNVTWDLQMIEYNTGDHLPQDIRSGLQR